MRTLKLTNGDLVTVNGSLPVLTGIEACMQNCSTAMQAMQGEMMFAKKKGMPYKLTVWDNYNPKLFEAAARTVILAVPDVVSVLKFNQNMENNVLSYSATIQTKYGIGRII